MHSKTTGTTGLIQIPVSPASRKIKPGDGYFFVQVEAAQAVVSRSFWYRSNYLVVVSHVALGHPDFGRERTTAIQQRREVRGNSAVQLGLSPDIIHLTPATVDHFSISFEFLLDRKNRLSQISSLINNNAFVNVVSLAPVHIGIVKAMSAFADKLINTLVDVRDRVPILEFTGDFNLAGDGLSDAYYAILAKQGQQVSFPQASDLTVVDGQLLNAGNPITNLSYVLLRVKTVKVRKKDLGRGTAWYAKLDEVDRITTSFARKSFIRPGDQRNAWQKCADLLKEAHVLIHADPLYLSSEATKIIDQAFSRANKILRPPDSAVQAPPIFDSETRALLGVGTEAELEQVVTTYEQEVQEAEATLTSLYPLADAS